MSVYLMQLDFKTDGPFKVLMTQSFRELAEDIAQQEGLLWKIWTENEDEKRAGGWYAFESHTALMSYKDMHAQRLENFGITDIRCQIFEANVPLSAITHFPETLISQKKCSGNDY